MGVELFDLRSIQCCVYTILVIAAFILSYMAGKRK